MKQLGWSGLAAIILLAAGAAFADIESNDDSCVYNQVEYPPGTQLCQNGDLVRCEDGAWSDEGDCNDQSSPPSNDGGDQD